MKKLIMLAICLVILPLGASATTTWYYALDASADHGTDDTFKAIGKPALSTYFNDLGDCDDTSGNWDSGYWQGISYVVVEGSSAKSSRLGEAYFVDSGISKGTNLSNVNAISGTCTQDVSGETFTFKRFSAEE